VPQRTREHELETESRRDFANRIPSRWVVRDVTPDYGIDQQVEIFEEGRATGLEFCLQLKGTDQDFPAALAVSIPRPHADYYRALSLPVLMCRFHAPTGRLFVKWFHAFDPHYAARMPREDAKTFTFRWGEADEWEDSTPRLIREIEAFRRFRDRGLRFPIAFHVQTVADLVPTAEALLVMREQAARVPRVIALNRDAPEPGEAVIRIERDRLVASLGAVSSVSVHRDSQNADRFDRREASDALVTIALALLHIGYPGEAAQIIAAVAADSEIVLAPEVAFPSAGAFALSGRPLEALQVARSIGQRGNDDAEAAEIVFAAATLGDPSTEEVREEYRSVLRARAERRLARGDSEWAGADCYNIGNSFRASHDPRGALRNYIRAARLAPHYRDRPYFNHEVGGILFETDHFELAAAFYGTALELGGSPRSRGLYADALFFAGRYREAADAFADVVASGHSTSEWRLKQAALERIRRFGGDHQHRRSAVAEAALAAAITATDDRSLERIKEDLGQVLELDALADGAWVSLAGIVFEQEESEAAQLLLVAALIRRHDQGTWVGAFALEWRTDRREERMLDIGAAAAFLVGEPFRAAVAEWARREENQADREDILEVLNRAEELEERDDGFVLRFASEEGIEEILIEPPAAS
jgi:hypothetical protein